MPAVLPSADDQLQFLQKIQRLLEAGRFTSTYKFALLIALTNVAVERGNDTNTALTIELADVAREFLALYWPQAKPYLHLGAQLSQNNNKLKPATILTLLRREVAVGKSDYARLRRNTGEPDRLVTAARELIVRMPLPRLQHIEALKSNSSSADQFLYKCPESADEVRTLRTITLLPGVGACLRALRGVIIALVQARWAQWVRENNPALGRDRNLEAFMFGQDRVALAQLAPKLYELQDGRCFYTQKRLDSIKAAEVDHFIAWARYPSNDPLNLVLASRAANNDKRDHIPSTRHLSVWLARNMRHAQDLINSDSGEGLESSASVAIAHWAYSAAAAVGSRAWDAPKQFVEIGDEWVRLLTG